jgi:hypothetical protein
MTRRATRKSGATNEKSAERRSSRYMKLPDARYGMAFSA